MVFVLQRKLAAKGITVDLETLRIEWEAQQRAKNKNNNNNNNSATNNNSGHQSDERVNNNNNNKMNSLQGGASWHLPMPSAGQLPHDPHHQLSNDWSSCSEFSSRLGDREIDVVGDDDEDEDRGPGHGDLEDHSDHEDVCSR